MMYGEEFCKIYNEFGWNYYPEAFGEKLLIWMQQNRTNIKSALDIGCGTGVLCEILTEQGIKACGVDLSESMIRIAKERNGNIPYEVANMITYRPDKSFDLVTCTGDALNHIVDLNDVAKVFDNVLSYLNDGGYFIFDILNEREVGTGDPIDLEYSDTVSAQFHITRDEKGIINLKTSVFENGDFSFEENITETVHDPEKICHMLIEAGFSEVHLSDRLLADDPNPSTTWYVTARK